MQTASTLLVWSAWYKVEVLKLDCMNIIAEIVAG